MSKEQIETFLNMQTNLVKRNVKIVSAGDIGQNYMLHISHENMSNKKYQPWIGTRQAVTEDRTVPRITVTLYLIGCLHGYGSIKNSLIEYGKNGVFYIHKILFDYCLKPTVRLVYDSDLTDEHWLVRYNRETTFYYPRLVGKLIVTGMDLDFNSKEDHSTIKVFLDQITEEIPVLPGVFAKSGKSELEFKYDMYANELKENKDYKLKKSNRDISLENHSSVSSILLNW